MLPKEIDILCGNRGENFHGLANVFGELLNAEQRKVL
jgi:hypothetical protein